MIDCEVCQGTGEVCIAKECSINEEDECDVLCEHVIECPKCKGIGKVNRDDV